MGITLNDKPIGTKRLSEAVQGLLSWKVPYEAGVLKAVGGKPVLSRVEGNDTAVCEYVLRTAGPSSQIKLLPDVTQLRGDGKDICHIEVQIVDDQGVRVPDAQYELTFELDGPGEILGIENGDLNSLEDYKDRVHKVYHGRCLAILQSTRESGRIRLTAYAEGLEKASIEIEVQPCSFPAVFP